MPSEKRCNVEWHYVLPGEQVFDDWGDKGASIRDMLEYAKLRPVDERVQVRFAFECINQTGRCDKRPRVSWPVGARSAKEEVIVGAGLLLDDDTIRR